MGLTGIICAFDGEAAPFLAALTDISVITYAKLDFHIGSLRGASAAVVISGVCKVNAAMAAQIMADRFDNLERVIFSGTAGGMDKRLRIGDTVIVTESVYHDVENGVIKPGVFKSDNALIRVCRDALKESPPGQSVYYGRTVTGEGFIINEGRGRVVDEFNPLCVDMETAAAAHVCYMNGIPFLAVRSVTDTEAEAGYGSFFANVTAAAKNSYEVVVKILDKMKGCQ